MGLACAALLCIAAPVAAEDFGNELDASQKLDDALADFLLESLTAHSEMRDQGLNRRLIACGAPQRNSCSWRV